MAKVVTMGSMFNGAHVFNMAVTNWNVAQVTNMTSMFQNTRSFNQGKSNAHSKLSFFPLQLVFLTFLFSLPSQHFRCIQVGIVQGCYYGIHV